MTMKSRARWAETATDLSHDLTAAAKHLRLAELADATGLSPKTIEDSLTREKITNPANPRGAIDRPAYHVSGMPLWDKAQLAEYRKRQRAAGHGAEDLPMVTAGDDEGLYSAAQVAEHFGVHTATVRRWQRNFGDTYPRVVARRSRSGRPGVPEDLREIEAIEQWAAGRGITPAREAVPS